jgi:hypothetical protein
MSDKENSAVELLERPTFLERFSDLMRINNFSFGELVEIHNWTFETFKKEAGEVARCISELKDLKEIEDTATSSLQLQRQVERLGLLIVADVVQDCGGGISYINNSWIQSVYDHPDWFPEYRYHNIKDSVFDVDVRLPLQALRIIKRIRSLGLEKLFEEFGILEEDRVQLMKNALTAERVHIVESGPYLIFKYRGKWYNLCNWNEQTEVYDL